MPAADALDADEVVVAAEGTVYVAPVGTAAPADFSAAYSATWVNLGYCTEDGVSFAPNMDLKEVMAWQSTRPVRRAVISRTEEISFGLLQWSATTLPVALGGGSVATSGTGATEKHTYTPPDLGDEPDYRALSIAWTDGDKDYRLFAPKALVTDLAEFSLTRTDESPLPLTFATMAEAGVAPFTIDTNDPAFAAS